ncbi:hypothetical protein ABT160_07525 [Streptomyces sp. NPDC001941]|uniref:hypothetical protein n=1 Tax=Streptomyces sp. NPDC001941 TaxID=3154659 RepID=UPI00332FA531
MEHEVNRWISWRPWGRGRLTGGPVDEVLARVHQAVPGVAVARLAVIHEADDDNVYLLGDVLDPDQVQLDTGPGGQWPFLVEADGLRLETTDVAEATRSIIERLRSGVGGGPEPAVVDRD